MARGWESKSIEDQMASMEESFAARKAAHLIDFEQTARKREIESIELSRERVLSDLVNAKNPKYREILQRSLDFLDEKLTRAKSVGA